jgi:tRNA wybutosine-synthesizing protein 5
VANLKKDLPELSEDIRFPNFFGAEKFFSSVLRLSSRDVQLWTHYDVGTNENVILLMIAT